MPEITELDPSELEDEDYDGMPELCDSQPTQPQEASEETKPEEEEKEVGGDVEELPRCVDDDGWEDVLGSGRLRKKILREGDRGRGRPDRGASCTINITERLAGDVEGEGEEVASKKVLEFMVGESEVMQAVDLVVPLMVPGEVALVRLESSFGYGAAGDGDRVGPQADLELHLELVDWEVLGAVPDIPRDRRMGIGMRKRERGNKHFARGDYSTAVMCYR